MFQEAYRQYNEYHDKRKIKNADYEVLQIGISGEIKKITKITHFPIDDEYKRIEGFLNSFDYAEDAKDWVLENRKNIKDVKITILTNNKDKVNFLHETSYNSRYTIIKFGK